MERARSGSAPAAEGSLPAQVLDATRCSSYAGALTELPDVSSVELLPAVPVQVTRGTARVTGLRLPTRPSHGDDRGIVDRARVEDLSLLACRDNSRRDDELAGEADLFPRIDRAPLQQ